MSNAELARLTRQYRALLESLQQLGFVVPGSVLERYTGCGSEGCRCHTDHAARHGPYFQYTRKLAGKTLSRMLTAEQAQRYREWVANRRRLDQTTAEMDQLSHQAAELLLNQETPPGRRHPKRDRPEPEN